MYKTSKNSLWSKTETKMFDTEGILSKMFNIQISGYGRKKIKNNIYQTDLKLER